MITVFPKNLCTHHFPHREVTPEEGEKRAKELNTMFIETSAKAGHNVRKSFEVFSEKKSVFKKSFLLQVKTLFRKIAQALPGINNENDDQKDQSELTAPVPQNCRIVYTD